MSSFSLLSYFIIQCPNESVSTKMSRTRQKFDFRMRTKSPIYILHASRFSDQLEKHKLVEEVDILLPVKFHKIPFSGFRGKVKKKRQKRIKNLSQQIRGKGVHLVFLIGPKNTNLVEDLEILLPVKFRW